MPDALRCRFARLPNPAAELATAAELTTAAELATAAEDADAAGVAVKIRVLTDLAMALVLRTIGAGECRSSYYVEAGYREHLLPHGSGPLR